MIEMHRLNRAPITIMQLGGALKQSGSHYGIVINPETRAVGDYAGIGAGMPAEIYHQRVLFVPVRRTVHQPSLINAISENFDLIHDLIACYQGVEYNGSDTVGVWSDLHVDLFELLRDTLINVPDLFDAGDYIHGSALSDLLAYGETVDDIAQGLIEEGADNAVYLDRVDLIEALQTYLADEYQSLADDRDMLNADEIGYLDAIATALGAGA